MKKKSGTSVPGKKGRKKVPLDVGFGPLVSRLRQEAGLSMDALAKAAGCQASAICMVEKGQRGPFLRTALALLVALGVPFTILSELDPRGGAEKEGQ